MRKAELTVEAFVDGILCRDRVIIGRAITLIESKRPQDNHKALEIIERILPHTGSSIRIGITGVPGVGKSTFIEALGTIITDEGHRLAVLAVDPTSSISRGSIMGDKTRMHKLACNPHAYIRPSPSAGSLGGVAYKTREAMLVCEAAGFDVVFVETVGVGQSETIVSSMVDFFLLLVLAGAGDHLQGIKRGIMELADAVAITKADGRNRLDAERARVEYEQALHLLRPPVPGWSPSVVTCSARTNEGIREIWALIREFEKLTKSNGSFQQKRNEQMQAWMYETIRDSLFDRFRSHPAVSSAIPAMEARVIEGKIPPITAAQKLLNLFSGKKTDKPA
ncbi:MAG: methylmalonyl Co-A mutase-associated GTPase MeaB [Bacteroidota bacterium]|nr:methylmalonyl Co-A mutase-associated GTPase MeaB [Bacteroidota bacterium]